MIPEATLKTTTAVAQQRIRHPPGLYTLFFAEMWERFSYYGMRALLTLFMVAPVAAGGLGYDIKRAALIYGSYTMTVYMLSIPGGFIADNFLGSRLSVLYGGIVIALGHFTLALHAETAFYAGLVLIALGTGLLKPNMSALVGALYAPGDERRDAGFSIYYMGINIGAFSAPLVTGWLAQSLGFKSLLAGWGFDPVHSWHWGFAAAGVGMTLGLIAYVWSGHRLAHVGRPPPKESPRPWGKLVLVLLGAGALFWVTQLADANPSFAWLRYGYVALPVVGILWFGFQSKPESRRMAAVLVFSLAALIFWAIFEQAGSTISLFSDHSAKRRQFELAGLEAAPGQSFPLRLVSVNQFALRDPARAGLRVVMGATRQPATLGANEVRFGPDFSRSVILADGAGSRTDCPARGESLLGGGPVLPANSRRALSEPGGSEHDDQTGPGKTRWPDDGNLVSCQLSWKSDCRACRRKS